jgi:hypothetical protein
MQRMHHRIVIANKMNLRQFFVPREWLRIAAILGGIWIASYLAMGSVGAATTITVIFFLLGFAGLFYT